MQGDEPQVEPRAPAFKHEYDADDAGDCAHGKENSLHQFALRVEKNRQVEHCPYEQETPQINALADVSFSPVYQLAEEPRRKQQERERLLSLVAEQHPSHQCS